MADFSSESLVGASGSRLASCIVSTEEGAQSLCICGRPDDGDEKLLHRRSCPDRRQMTWCGRWCITSKGTYSEDQPSFDVVDTELR